MSWASARSSRAMPPQRTAKRALAIRAARSVSRPSAAPTSSCGFAGKSNVRGSLQWRTSTLSSSPLPSGTEGCGRFGSCNASVSSRSSTSFSSASSALMRSPTSRIRACSAPASSPRRLAWPMASEALLRRALRSSLSRTSRRRSVSSSISSGMRFAPPLVTSARRTASGCSRISRTSSTALLGFDRRGALRVDARYRAHAVVGVEVDDPHAPRVAPLGRHVGRVEANHLALRRDDQDVVAVPHLKHGDDVAVAAAGLDVDDPLAGPALQAILVERRALAEAALGDGEDADALLHDVGGDDLVALVDLDPFDAAGAVSHRAHFLLREADAHAELGRDHDLAAAVGPPGGHDAVVVVQTDGLDPAGARMRVGVQLGLLDRALLGREEDVAAGGEIAHRDTGGDLLPLAQRQEVHHRLALGLAPSFRDLVHLQPVNLAAIREEEQERVRGGHEQVGDDVLFLGLHAGDAHLLVCQEILDRELGGLGQYLGAPRVAILFLDRQKLGADDRHQLGVRGEDALQLFDERQNLLVLLDDLVALELGQALQTHVEDRARLDLGELELSHQGFARGVGALGLADQADHQVELLDRLAQARQDVGPLLGPGQVVARAPGDDLAAEAHERLEHLLEVDDLRSPVDQGQHDDAEGRLHLRVLVELVHHDLWDLAPSELEHHANALAVRLVADLGDAGNLLLGRELRDLLDQAGLVHLIRKLRDDDGLTAAPHLLGVRLGAQRDGAAAGRVCLADAAGAVDVAARREVRALDDLQELLDRRLRRVDQGDEPVDDLGEV